MTTMEQVKEWRAKAQSQSLTEEDFVQIAQYLRETYQIDKPMVKEKKKKNDVEISLDDLGL